MANKSSENKKAYKYSSCGIIDTYPGGHIEDLFTQTSLAVDCYNEVVSLYRKYSDKEYDLINSDEDVKRCMQNSDTLWEEFNKVKAQIAEIKKLTGGIKDIPENLIETYNNLKENAQKASADLKTARDNAKKKLLDQRKLIWHERDKEIRRVSSIKYNGEILYWGTKAAYVGRSGRIKAAVTKVGPGRISFLPKAQEFRSGAVYRVQLQVDNKRGYVPLVRDLFDVNSGVAHKAYISPTSSSSAKGFINGEYAIDTGKGYLKTKKPYNHALLYLRTGPKRNEFFTVFGIVLHRIPPLDAVLKEIRVIKQPPQKASRRNMGEYAVVIVVDENEQRPQIRKLSEISNPKIIALDTGWRNNTSENTIRVLYYHDTDGNFGEITIDTNDRVTANGRMKYGLSTLTQRKEHARAKIDQHHNDLHEQIKQQLVNNEDIPEWFTNAIRHFHKNDDLSPKQAVQIFCSYKSSEKTRRIIRFVEKQYPETVSSNLFSMLKTWEHRYKHLQDAFLGTSRKLLASRDDLYRNIAHQIAAKYDAVIVEDIDLKGLQRQNDITEKKKTNVRAKNIVAPSILLRYIEQAIAKKVEDGYIKVKCAYTTRTCHVCGFQNKFKTNADQYQKCKQCGAFWDRDFNASINILNRGLKKIPHATKCECDGGTKNPRERSNISNSTELAKKTSRVIGMPG